MTCDCGQTFNIRTVWIQWTSEIGHWFTICAACDYELELVGY
jgi:hypothetical protein